MNYWLMKSEPTVFSVDSLAKAPRKTTAWDGVRNYQARNMLRDQMQKGDLAFFYHSSCETPGIHGVMQIVRTGYPDPTQFDPEDHHYDPKSDPDNPRWYCVDVKLERKLPHAVSLDALRAQKALAGMQILQRGNRLSVTPVTRKEWDCVLGLASPEKNPGGL
jgi:predicted RNA-binding protein with PUA-like domain